MMKQVSLLRVGQLAFLAVPATFGLSSPALAAFPTGVSNVMLSEPSSPSTSASYSSARYDGTAASGQTGKAMAIADLNGDGYLDLAVGAPGASSSGGDVYIIYGTSTAVTSTYVLSSAVKISAVAGSALGTSLVTGDLTGDGKIDLAIGAPGVNGGIGAVYILPGGSSWSSTSDVTTIAGRVIVAGEAAGGAFGTSLAIGDLTAPGTAVTDGMPDLLVGAPGLGKAYLLYGSVISGTVATATGNGYNYTFYGLLEDNVGQSVAAPGDLNHDGSNDILIGGPHLDASKTTGNLAGVVYLINGRSKDSLTANNTTGSMNLNAVASKKRNIVGDLLYGSVRVGQAGAAVAGIGDVNNDGYADAAIGAPTAPKAFNANPECGRVYIVLGSSTLFDTATSWLSGAGFPSLYGETAYDRLGGAVSGVGDVDGDLYEDFLVGAPQADLSSTSPGDAFGAAYLLPGRQSASFAADALVTTAPSIRFYGKYRDDRAGSNLLGRTGLKLDGDSYGDFFIASPYFDTSTSGNQGRVYALYIGDFYDKDGDLQSKADADCNDKDPSVYHTSSGINEICNGKDDDCDSLIDDRDPSVSNAYTFYQDVDGDGYGATSLLSCDAAAPSGYVEMSGDCHDGDAAINPAAVEICDGLDNNCNMYIDDEDPVVSGQPSYFFDMDSDGFGSAESGVLYTCRSEAPEGYSVYATDCDDNDPDINPAALEVCDGVDEDCDQRIDDDPEDGLTYFADADGDGYGNGGVPVRLCEWQAGYVENADDCLDTQASVFPGSPETCDGFDTDCDGLFDEDNEAYDADMDGYLDANQCQAYGQNTGLPLDCNDIDAAINPDAAEDKSDGIDNDCDGSIDESGCGARLALEPQSVSSQLRGFFGVMPGVLLTGLLLRRRRKSPRA